jgi:hypothetical protein
MLIRRKKEFYLDNKQNIISSAVVPYDNYDPRTRTWYTLARSKKNLLPRPIMFKATGENGFTYSQQADNQHAVIGLDVSLASLSAFLQQQGYRRAVRRRFCQNQVRSSPASRHPNSCQGINNTAGFAAATGAREC